MLLLFTISQYQGFDPQALTSLTKEYKVSLMEDKCFDPQALTSLTLKPSRKLDIPGTFRSTGSYEPDRQA